MVRVENFTFHPYIKSVIRTGKDGLIGSVVATDTIVYDIKLVGKYEEIEYLLLNDINITENGIKITVFDKELDILELSTRQETGNVYAITLTALENAQMEVRNINTWFYALKDIMQDFNDLGTTDYVITNVSHKLSAATTSAITDTTVFQKKLNVLQILAVTQTIDVAYKGDMLGNGWINKILTEGLVEVNLRGYLYDNATIERINQTNYSASITFYTNKKIVLGSGGEIQYE